MLKCFLIFVSIFVATSETLAKENVRTTADYYPLAKGNQWDFNLSTQGQQVKMTNQVAKLEKIDDQSLFRVETQINGQTIANEHLYHTPTGLFRYRFNGIEMTPPLPLLKQPIKLGASWKSKVDMGGQKVLITCTLAKEVEKLKVPAGEFKTIKLDVETTVQGQPVTSTYWFAPGVGIVKQKLNIAGQLSDIELVDFKLSEIPSEKP